MNFLHSEAVYEIRYIARDAPDPFVAHVASTLRWYDKAVRWHAVALTIWDQFVRPSEPGGFYSMEMVDEWAFAQGTTIELLAKAVLFAEAEAEWDAMQAALSSVRGHDLNSLAVDVGLELSRGHTRTLTFLSEAIWTFGRYPAGRTLERTPHYRSTHTKRIATYSTEVLQTLDSRWRADVRKGPWGEWVVFEGEEPASAPL